MSKYAYERFFDNPSAELCLTDYGVIPLQGPCGDPQVEDLKIHHWRETAGNRANDFTCERIEAGMPADREFEKFTDELANPHIRTFFRPYDREVPGCREEVLRQLTILERDPRELAVTNVLLGTCMGVFEFCDQIPPHIELN